MIKTTEKRIPRSYKIADKTYNKAKRRAKREKSAVANLVEGWITAYSEGYTVGIIGSQLNQNKK